MDIFGIYGHKIEGEALQISNKVDDPFSKYLNRKQVIN